MKQFLIFAVLFLTLHAQAQFPFGDPFKTQDISRQISESSIIGLGELGHGYETINETKAAVAGMLQGQFNFKAISFESSFTESIVSFLSGDTIDDRARNFLYPFWNTTSVKAVLKVFSSNEKHNPLIVGFDIQEDCRYTNFSTFLISQHIVSENIDKLLECDTILSYYIGKTFSRKGALTEQKYELLINNYDIVQTEINIKQPEAENKKLIEHCLRNRKWLCKYLTLTTAKEKMYYRDSVMAQNIAWLRKELYPDKKLIVWAANTHIAKSINSKNPKWMGEWLSQLYPDEYFSIAFEKGATNQKFIWENSSYKYFSNPIEKFNLIIYLSRLEKIKPKEWMTPCD